MSSGRARIFRYLGFVIALAVFASVVVAARPADVWDALGQVEGSKPWIAVALNLVIMLLWTLRSMLVLRQMGHSITLPVLLPVTVLGNVAGSLTPGGSGEVLRAAALQRSAGLGFGESVTLVAYERVLSTYLLLLSTVACLSLVSLSAAAGVAVAAVCAVLVLAPWLSAVFLLPRLPAAPEVAGAGLPRKLLRYGLRLATEIQGLLVSLPLLLAWSALTVASYGLVALQFQLIAASLGVHIDLLEGLVTFGGSGFAVIASLLPLGLGVGDGSIAAIINQLAGVPFERATAVAVLVRAAITLPLLAAALLSYMYLMRSTARASDEGPG